MNPSAGHYSEQHRSLSSTTQYATQFGQYQAVSHPQAQYNSAGYAANGYAASGDSQQLAYAAQQQSIPQMPASYTIPPNPPYPGATSHPSLQMQYADGRAMGQPAVPAYSGHPHAYSSQQGPTSPYLPQQQQLYSATHYSQSQQQHPSSTARYPPTPAQALQHQNARHSSSSYPRSLQSPPSPSNERFPCDKCDKTFSRAHDRKRHHESQHSPHPTSHRCPYCSKEFSRSDSMKRHVDNGCEKDPSFTGSAV